MCGGISDSRRIISRLETEYLDALVRGVYARRDLDAGYVFSKDDFENDFYLAIPLNKGQLSCREIINGEKLVVCIKAHETLTINHIDGPYNENESMRNLILNRGI